MSSHAKLAMESVLCIPCSYNHSTTKLPVFVLDVTIGSLVVTVDVQLYLSVRDLNSRFSVCAAC